MLVSLHDHDRSTSEVFHSRRDKNPRSRSWRISGALAADQRRNRVFLLRSRYITFRPFRQMKKYRLDLLTHEYHIRRNGLCTLQASSAPFSKLNYLSPFPFVSSSFRCASLSPIISCRIALCTTATCPEYFANSRDPPGGLPTRSVIRSWRKVTYDCMQSGTPADRPKS